MSNIDLVVTYVCDNTDMNKIEFIFSHYNIMSIRLSPNTTEQLYNLHLSPNTTEQLYNLRLSPNKTELYNLHINCQKSIVQKFQILWITRSMCDQLLQKLDYLTFIMWLPRMFHVVTNNCYKFSIFTDCIYSHTVCPANTLWFLL